MTKTIKLLLLATIIFALHSINLFGQKANIGTTKLNLSEEFKERFRFPAVIASDTSVAYIKTHVAKQWIRSYEFATKKLRPKFKLSDVLDEAGVSYEGNIQPFIYKGNLIYFSQNYSKRDDLLTLFATVISKEGTLIGTPKEFAKIYTKKENRVTIKIDQNQDNFTLRAKVILDRNDEEELVVANYSYDFKQLSYFKFNNKEILEEKEGEMFPPLYGFSDSLYMINIFTEDRKKRKVKPITSVYVYTKTGKKLFSQELNTDNISLFSFKLLKTEKESRLVAYYSDDKSDGIDGTVTYIYDNKINKFVVKDATKIPFIVKAAFLSDRSLKKDKGILPFAFSSTEFTDNGEMYNVDEQSIRVTYTTTDPKTGRTQTTVSYHTGTNLLIEKFDSTGKVDYITNLETPGIGTGSGPSQVYHLITQKNKAAVYTILYPRFLPSRFQSKVKGFDKRAGVSVFICNLKDVNQKNWNQVKFSKEKSYTIAYVSYLKDRNQAFVMLANRGPWIVRVFKGLFRIKSKSKVGVADITLE